MTLTSDLETMFKVMILAVPLPKAFFRRVLGQGEKIYAWSDKGFTHRSAIT